MPVRYNFSNPDIHWRNFFTYACDKLNLRFNMDANFMFHAVEPVLKEYNGRLVWPSNGENVWSSSLEALEFDTPEDLLFFKLKFN